MFTLTSCVWVRATVQGCLINFSITRRKSGWIIAALIALLVVSPPGIDAAMGTPSYPGEYVITLKQQSMSPGRVGTLAADGLGSQVSIRRRLGGQAALVSTARYSTSVPGQMSALGTHDDDDVCKRLVASGQVESCTPNFKISTADVIGPDPLLDSLWGMKDSTGISAESAWTVSTGSSDVVVAVIDTGIDYTHEDLADNIWVNPGEIADNGVDDDGNGYVDDIRGINLSVGAPNIADPMDDNQHGTHVAGTIGAVHNNAAGVRGVSGGVKLLPIKFMDSSGSGRLSDAIAAIDYMVDLKVNRGVNIVIANNSWGGGGYSLALEDAIKRARDAGIIFVVAAGNDGADIDQFPAYPASYEVENIIRVAAVDEGQNLATFSNYGAVGVDIAAPGVNITSTLPGNRYGSLSGTSMAAPHVAGGLALLYSMSPSVTPGEAIIRLVETGRELSSLSSPDGTLWYIRSGRILNVARLLADERVPLRQPGDGLPPCGYSFQVSNIVESGSLDTAADRLNPINQVDEGDFRALNLPFDFPFFRSTTRTLYVSPNGVVYLHPPRSADYQVGRRSPNNSIAAFHTDLIPRTAKQGVRAYVGADRAVIYWLSEHYSLADRGPIAVRLTLYRSGLIRSTVSFESARDPISLSWLALGNGLLSPAAPPMGLIGASAASSAFASTVDIAAAQRELASTSNERLDLGVAMVPNCISSSPNTPPEQELQIARVDGISMRILGSQHRVAVKLVGVGSGKVPVRAAINGRQCSQIAWGTLSNGVGAFRLSVPRSARKLSLLTTDKKKSVLIKNRQQTARRQRQSKMCAELLQLVR